MAKYDSSWACQSAACAARKIHCHAISLVWAAAAKALCLPPSVSGPSLHMTEKRVSKTAEKQSVLHSFSLTQSMTHSLSQGEESKAFALHLSLGQVTSATRCSVNVRIFLSTCVCLQSGIAWAEGSGKEHNEQRMGEVASEANTPGGFSINVTKESQAHLSKPDLNWQASSRSTNGPQCSNQDRLA